jgi:hypothetical protein
MIAMTIFIDLFSRHPIEAPSGPTQTSDDYGGIRPPQRFAGRWVIKRRAKCGAGCGKNPRFAAESACAGCGRKMLLAKLKSPDGAARPNHMKGSLIIGLVA